MWRTIGVTFERNGGHRDDRTRCQPCLELVVLRLTIGQPEPPSVVVHHQADVIWVVESLRSPSECRIVEPPLRGRCPPNELGEIVPVLVVARPTSLRRKVVLIPPVELCLRRQRCSVRLA